MNLHIGDDDKSSLESLVLAHGATKNMAWGENEQKKLDYHNKVASDKSSPGANLNYKLRVATLPELVKHNGDIKKIAGERVKKLQAQKDSAQSANSKQNISVVDLVKPS